MKVRLMSCTIVPEQLYVERDADRQLKSIIDEMERPGYVLVSRQMGKTNLLIHAKDNYENDREVYVYVDFSTVDDLTERDFFRNVIDTAIETHYEIFKEANSIISSLRQDSTLSNQRQYTREIRILLRYVDKLVFIFDEIDALTKTNYSDKVFSQIRSDYFQRVNFRELRKLTYILSGVIEPKDIIKNPNISPFNIGQKIYLNDFDRREFDSFIYKSELLLSESVKDRLFYWTKGNPRMTWDICVLLQDMQNLDVVKLDEAIGRYYFESFDKVPIDTIREMVSKDKVLREALIQLYYGKIDALDDSLKQKLYLAGIVNYQDRNIVIKNPIVEKSLSLDWLMKLQNDDVDYLEKVYDSIYIRHDYLEAIRLLERMLSLNTASKDELNKICLYLGESYYRTVKFSKALFYLQKINSSEVTKEVIQGNLLEGYVYVNQDDTKNALNCFDRNIKIGKETGMSDAYIDESKLGKAEAMIESKDKTLLAEANSLLVSFIAQNDLGSINIPLLPKAHYLLARVKEEDKQINSALEELDAAIMMATEEEKPFLLYQKLLLLKKDEDRNNVAKRLLLSLDKKTDVQILENFDYTLKLDVYTLCLILAELILHFKEFKEVIPQYLKLLNESKEAAYNTICKTLLISNEKNAEEFARLILKLSENDKWNFGTDHIFTAYMAVFQKTRKIEDAIAFYKFMKQVNFSRKNFPSVDARFLCEMLVNVVYYYVFTIHDYITGKDVVKLFNDNFGQDTDNVVRCMALKKDYASYAISVFTKKPYIAFDEGGRFLLKWETFLNRVKDLDNSLIDDLKSIVKFVQDHQRKIFRAHQIMFVHKYGRNDLVIIRYIDSSITLSKKYKDIEDDLELGKCKILNMMDRSRLKI